MVCPAGSGHEAATEIRQVCRRFGKFGGYQVFIGNPPGQLAGFFQNVLQQIKAFFRKNRILFPGVLLQIRSTMMAMSSRSVSRELGLYGFGDFLGGVGVDVGQPFLDGVGKTLDDLRMFLDIALSGGIGR